MNEILQCFAFQKEYLSVFHPNNLMCDNIDTLNSDEIAFDSRLVIFLTKAVITN